MKKTIIKARCISPGVAEGEALVSKSRISFWGGADVMKGIFTERGHELENCSFKDKILVFQSTKGSSGTSGMLKWSKINGVAPRAFINSDLDALAVLSCVAANFLWLPSRRRMCSPSSKPGIGSRLMRPTGS